jgi:hypothetical protein
MAVLEEKEASREGRPCRRCEAVLAPCWLQRSVERHDVVGATTNLT